MTTICLLEEIKLTKIESGRYMRPYLRLNIDLNIHEGNVIK